MKKNIVRIVSIAAVAVFATALTAQGGVKWDFTQDNADMNNSDHWQPENNPGQTWYEDSIRPGEITGNEYTGYLDTTYDGSQSGIPPTGSGSEWIVQLGHMEFRDGANFTEDVKQFQIWGAHAADATEATITVNEGATLDITGHNENLAVADGSNYGTFTVDGGALITQDTEGNGGVNLGDRHTADLGTSDAVGIFEVKGTGTGGEITVGADFGVSPKSEVHFELDSAGEVEPIDVANELSIYENAGDSGVLKIDTSAFETSSGSVDLFNYGSLTGEFGTVEVLGSELSEGNGSDPLTYNLDYGTNTLSMTYNNVPEPSSLVLLGIAGLLLMKRRRV